jgi:5'-3' exonuclease
LLTSERKLTEATRRSGSMGIPYYVASLLRSHRQLQQPVTGRPVVDCLGIDFNCFIHAYLKPENPIGSIVLALRALLTEVVDAKRVYIAFDGLVPLAKMVQQRYRRMRIGETDGFDKHQISPGTPFMRKLARSVRMLFPEAVVSDTLDPGEGEHKIFLWLRSLPESERRTTMIYGLDADLVVIALAQAGLSSSLSLLREQDTGSYTTLNISGLKQVLPVDAETFVRMSLSFGNDFLPALAVFSLREEGYGRALYHATHSAITAGEERTVLLKRAKPTDRKIVAPDGHALEARLAVHLMDGVLNWEPVCLAYWKTWEWVYQYFTTSIVPDWEWVYPYPEAPLVRTLEDFDRPSSFVWDHPEPTRTIEDQLAFILPERSLRETGLVSQWPDELYDEETETRHPWMKKYAWECDPWVSLPMGPLTAVTEFHCPRS